MISTPVKEILVKLLYEYADNIRANNTHLTEEQAGNILSLVAHIELTKEEACDLLNMSRSSFDSYVSAGKLPKGIKIAHKHNLIWYKDELLYYSKINIR
jgi:predicted DNA-binding transcriptional regulator AlpA